MYSNLCQRPKFETPISLFSRTHSTAFFSIARWMELPTVLIGIESVKIARNKHTTVTQQSHDTYYTQLIKIRNSQAYYLFPSSGATYVQHWISSSSHHTHQLPKESFSDVRHSPDMDISNINSRVVLLLDLDCFYAQCETVRLGLDPSMPLCLLQWNYSNT